MKKVLSIFLVLVVISQVFCATAFADSTELQHIQIPCQYIIWFDVYEDIIDGYFIDGSVYVEPSVIEMLTGYTAFQNEGKIVFTPTTSSPTLIYTIDAANEKLTRTAIATETTWDVDCIQLGDGTYCVNLEETLLAMNVQIAFSSDEEFSLCTYLPYTVYDAWEEYKNKQFNLFSLTEFGDISSDKISNLGVLSALNSLYLDYNDHFVKDSVLSWWSSDVLNATEDNFKDTMLEILLCMSDEKDGTWGSNPDYKSIKQDTKVLRLAAKMLKLLDVETEEGNIVAVLNATTSFGTKVISLTDFANTISQYKAVQETQRDMLKELFIAFPNYSEPQNGALKYVKNAAMFLSQRLEDNGVGTFSAICDGVIDLFSDVLEGTISEVTPVLTIVKAVSDTIKGVPGLSNLADINKHTNVACNSWALLELSTENYVSYRKCVEQYKFPTEDELYRLKLVMLFKIMASVTVRQNIIDAKLSDKSALKELAQKNTELKSLYALILSSKPIAAPKDNTPTINWEEYVRKYNDGQVSQVIDTINFANHDSMVRLYTDFVESGSYQRFIPDSQNSYESVYGTPSKYAILDINGDGIEELIIAGETASEFTNFMVFSYDKGHDEIYSLSLHSVASGKEDEGFSLCYGSLQFSARFHALVFTETRPEYFGGVDFFVVKGRDIVSDFSLWFERDIETQQVTYGITESGTTEILSEGEYFSYMGESSELEWNPISPDHEEGVKGDKVLLAVNEYDENDTLIGKTQFEYEGMLIIRTTTQTYRDSVNETVYDYTYDDEGRLLSKHLEGSEDSGVKGDAAVDRSYNDEGLLVSESYLGAIDYWMTEEYTYDNDGQLIWQKETAVKCGTDNVEYDRVETVYSYSHYTDEQGNLVSVRHNEIYPDSEYSTCEYIYNAAGQMIQDYEDYWLTPIKYEYIDDPYFCVRDELKTVDYGNGKIMDASWRMAYILDSAGKVVYSFIFGRPETVQMDYDEDGYLISAVDIERIYYGATRYEFIYGELDDVK